MFCQVFTATTRWLKEPLQISAFQHFFSFCLCVPALCWRRWYGNVPPDSNLLVHEGCECAWVALCMVELPHVPCYLTIHVVLNKNGRLAKTCSGGSNDVFQCSYTVITEPLYTKIEKELLKCYSLAGYKGLFLHHHLTSKVICILLNYGQLSSKSLRPKTLSLKKKKHCFLKKS